MHPTTLKNKLKYFFSSIHKKDLDDTYVYNGPELYSMSYVNVVHVEPGTANFSGFLSNPQKTTDFDLICENEEDNDDYDLEIIDISNYEWLPGKEADVSCNQSNNLKNVGNPKISTTDKYSLLPLYSPELMSDLDGFVWLPAPKNVTMKCRIFRHKSGVEKGFYPFYYLFLDRDDGNSLFLLASRRRKKSTSSNYIITSNETNLKRHGSSFVGKLRSNFMGTNYVVFDYGKKVAESDFDCTKCRRELAGISYDTSSTKLKCPRKMTVVIPEMNQRQQRMDFYKTKGSCSMLENWKNNTMNNISLLYNKTPIWNKDTRSYNLDFHDRVTQSSVKNFQLVLDNDVDFDVMQFGKISKDMFMLEFSYPLCALQAFGIALSSFDNKISCE